MKILTKNKQRELGAIILESQIMVNKYPFQDTKGQVEIFDKLSENLCSIACEIGGIGMAFAIQEQAFPKAYREDIK